AMTGYCSNCHKVWTSEERQGICRWCSRNANCVTTPTKPRQLKSSRRRSHRQVDDGNNGYDHLPEPYLTYYKIALRFGHKALLDEQDDLLHDIIEGLARVAKDRALGEAAMYRIAEHIKDHYWYEHYAYHNGLDCQHCGKVQRAKCRTAWAYSDWAYYDCRRAITLESINQPIIDSEGNITELAELIADDKALDLEEWLDAKIFLIGAPIRLKQIARKLNNKVEALTVAERKYLCKLRRKTQKTLV
ncbi:MAG: hypothetical protein OEV56_01215, partial [Dehalococcoidia bacterium]|nr:hypothetical protein [Dehalococcoidia bacterium]